MLIFQIALANVHFVAVATGFCEIFRFKCDPALLTVDVKCLNPLLM